MLHSRVLRQSKLLEWIPFYKPKPAITDISDIETIADREAEAEKTRLRSQGSVEARRIHNLDSRADLDAITARGLLKSTKCYQPPDDLEEVLGSLVASASSGAGPSSGDWRSVSLSDPALKFTICQLARKRFDRSVPNSHLHKLKTAGDLFHFYSQPVSNLTDYVQLARDPKLPPNLTLVEHNPSFHPDDKDAPHGGVTAFPGLSRLEPNLRHQRMYRELRAETIKSHHDEVGFDYTEDAPSKAPWNQKQAMKAERMMPYGQNPSRLL